MSQPELARSIVGASFILPIVNGAMHLPPAVSATHATLGHDQPLDIPILALLFALHVLIDVLDKYADLPPDVRKVWQGRIAIFASPFVLLVAWGTWHCGPLALLRLLGVPLLAVVHGTPLIPTYSWKTGEISLVKLKAILGPFKSIFGATCIGLMDVTAIVLYLRGTMPHQADPSSSRHYQILTYTIVYDFLWESVADIRDLKEDLHDGVITLATAFGVKRTLILLAGTTLVGDMAVTLIGGGSAVLSAARAVCFWGAFSALALCKPRRATYAWGVGSLVGLLPVWLAGP